MVFDAALLNTQPYEERIKGKMEQSREWSSVLPYVLVQKLSNGEPSFRRRLRSLTYLLFPTPVLVDDEFYIQFEFNYLSEIKTNLFKLNYTLAFYNYINQERILDILRVDISQIIKYANIIKCLNSLAWPKPNGIAPFGNVQHFRYNYQITSVEPKNL